MKLSTYILTLIFFFLVASSTQGQDTTSVLSNKFDFKNGIYHAFSSFQQNNPDVQWADLKVSYFINSKTGMAHVGPVIDRKTGNAIQLNKVWGMSIEGVPYILMQPTEEPKLSVTFTPIRLRGKICYLSYEQEVEKYVTFSAYNPLTGRPFRTAKEKRTVVETVKQIMHFDSGEFKNFTIGNFLDWIEDDEQLYNTVKDLTLKEAEEKLYKCLLIYNDRNLIQIK